MDMNSTHSPMAETDASLDLNLSDANFDIPCIRRIYFVFWRCSLLSKLNINDTPLHQCLQWSPFHPNINKNNILNFN